MYVQLEVAVVVAFFALVFGYGVGRRHGQEEGFRRGINFAPLEMRRFTLERGRCVICGAPSRGDAPPSGALDDTGVDGAEAAGPQPAGSGLSAPGGRIERSVSSRASDPVETDADAWEDEESNQQRGVRGIGG